MTWEAFRNVHLGGPPENEEASVQLEAQQKRRRTAKGLMELLDRYNMGLVGVAAL